MARLPCGVALTAATLAALCGLAAPAPAAAQAPLGIRTASGLTVTPVYEGWYENPDGTFSLSFGYYNRNFEEVVEVPLGEGNRMEPAVLVGAQPTRFHPSRHWGVFTVTVPADFGDQAVVWTLERAGRAQRDTRGVCTWTGGSTRWSARPRPATRRLCWPLPRTGRRARDRAARGANRSKRWRERPRR